MFKGKFAKDCQQYADTVFDPEDVILLVEQYGIHGECPKWTREEWRLEVAERNTQLGYWEWVLHSIEADDEDH